MSPLQDMLDALLAAGLPGIVLALVILVAVFLLKRGGVVVNGNMARLANVVLAVILSGLDPTNPNMETSFIAAIGTVVSALLFELVKFIGVKSNLLRR